MTKNTNKQEHSGLSAAFKDVFDDIFGGVDEAAVESQIDQTVLTSEERAIARMLMDEPIVFDVEHTFVLHNLTLKGVAADYGDVGYARGYRYNQFFL